MLRISAKPETRLPLISTIGMPPPRPRPLRVWGASSCSNSAMLDAPMARISWAFSVTSAGMSPSTLPRSRRPLTTMVPGSSAGGGVTAGSASLGGSGGSAVCAVTAVDNETVASKTIQYDDDTQKTLLTTNPCPKTTAPTLLLPGAGKSPANSRLRHHEPEMVGNRFPRKGAERFENSLNINMLPIPFTPSLSWRTAAMPTFQSTAAAAPWPWWQGVATRLFFVAKCVSVA